MPMPAPSKRQTLDLLERLRPLCLELPGAVEKLSHGSPTWLTRAKGKVFAAFDDHHHPEGRVSVHFAAPLEVQRALVAGDPQRYWVPPYVGHRGWVAMALDRRPAWRSLAGLLREAFVHVGGRPGR